MHISTNNYLKFITAKFELGGRRPEKMDCYGLVMALYALEGINLPDVATPDSMVVIDEVMSQTIESKWQECDDEPGALVHIKVPGVFSHVGMSFGNGLFVHIWEGSGSVEVQSIEDWKHRIKGFYRFVG